VENELAMLKMLTGQHISKYIIYFNSLASCCDWGDSALWHQFYKGLPNYLKDEVSQGDGKPKTLLLCNKRPKTLMQDIGNGKPKLLAKTTPVNQRRLITSPPLITPTTTLARRMIRNPTKARSSKTLESNNKPLDPLRRTTYPASWTRVGSQPNKNTNVRWMTTFATSVAKAVIRSPNADSRTTLPKHVL
jgi:hypothetical protein